MTEIPFRYNKKKQNIYVRDNETIKDLKHQISMICEIPIENIRIMIKDKILKDEKLLSKYKLNYDDFEFYTIKLNYK